jgi:hypothetical protein
MFHNLANALCILLHFQVVNSNVWIKCRVSKLKLNLVSLYQVYWISKFDIFNENCLIFMYEWNDLWGLCLARFCWFFLKFWNLLDFQNSCSILINSIIIQTWQSMWLSLFFFLDCEITIQSTFNKTSIDCLHNFLFWF